MRGIADQNHAAAMPFIERDPVDWAAMDLLVAFEGGEILLDDPAEIGKAAAQAVEPADRRLVSARFYDVAKAVGAVVAYRTQPEEAAFAEHKLQCAEALRTDGRDAASRHRAGIGGRNRAEGQGAHARQYPVRTRDQIVGTRGAVAEGNRHAVAVLGQ